MQNDDSDFRSDAKTRLVRLISDMFVGLLLVMSVVVTLNVI